MKTECYHSMLQASTSCICLTYIGWTKCLATQISNVHPLLLLDASMVCATACCSYNYVHRICLYLDAGTDDDCWSMLPGVLSSQHLAQGYVEAFNVGVMMSARVASKSLLWVSIRLEPLICRSLVEIQRDKLNIARGGSRLCLLQTEKILLTNSCISQAFDICSWTPTEVPSRLNVNLYHSLTIVWHWYIISTCALVVEIAWDAWM